MKAEAFIPARYASTRLAGKPLADICGKPMIRRVYERALLAKLVSRVTVATDDERIFKAVKEFGGRVVMTSSSHNSGTDRIAEAAAASDCDIIVNVQGDEPLIEPDMIDEAVRPMLDDPALKIATLKTRITEADEFLSPSAVKVVTDLNGFALYFSRSPLPHSLKKFEANEVEAYKHVGLYAYRRDFLFEFAKMPQTRLEKTERLEQLRALENGIKIKVVETRFNPLSVDTPEDLVAVNALVRSAS
jgi:3-deoxy-manno-octulosonate cytidylyltransferase (CMP-KDO synthetase)